MGVMQRSRFWQPVFEGAKRVVSPVFGLKFTSHLASHQTIAQGGAGLGQWNRVVLRAFAANSGAVVRDAGCAG